MRQRAICAKRLADGWPNGSPWVRARGRALRNCLRTAQGQARSRSIGEEPSGRGGPRARPLLLHWRGALGPSPKAQPMASTRSACKPFCSARPRARTQGRAMKRPAQTFRPSKRPCKRLRLAAQTFFNLFLLPPCARHSLLLHLQPSAMGRAFRRGAGNPHSPSD